MILNIVKIHVAVRIVLCYR